MYNVVESIKKMFVEQKRDIYEAISRDYKENKTEIQYNLLEEILLDTNISSNEENKTILAIYNGNIYIMLKIIIKSLIHNKNIILISDGENSHTKDKVLSIIKETLVSENSELVVKEYVNVDSRKILEQGDLIDRIIYFGDKRKYRNLKQNTDIEIKYNGYGSINVYTDDEDEFENELMEIEEYAYLNNMYIYKFVDDIDEEITQINKDGKNDLCIILSRDEYKIDKFKKEVSSYNILVNDVNFNVQHEVPESLFEILQ